MLVVYLYWKLFCDYLEKVGEFYFYYVIVFFCGDKEEWNIICDSCIEIVLGIELGRVIEMVC